MTKVSARVEELFKAAKKAGDKNTLWLIGQLGMHAADALVSKSEVTILENRIFQMQQDMSKLRRAVHEASHTSQKWSALYRQALERLGLPVQDEGEIVVPERIMRECV